MTGEGIPPPATATEVTETRNPPLVAAAEVTETITPPGAIGETPSSPADESLRVDPSVDP